MSPWKTFLSQIMADKKLDVSTHLRKVQLLNPSKTSSNQAGFKCSECMAAFNNYDSYLDHRNSKIHLKNTGFDKTLVLKEPELDGV